MSPNDPEEPIAVELTRKDALALVAFFPEQVPVGASAARARRTIMRALGYQVPDEET